WRAGCEHPTLFASLDDGDEAAGAALGLVRICVVALFLFLDDAVAAVLTDGAVCVAAVVTAGVQLLAVVALLTGGDDAVAADGQAFAASRVEARERQLEAGAFGLALGVEHLDLVDAAVLQT